jgi:cytoskeletal protein RodZ
VWHDNSGSSPSWFLSRIVVKDLRTKKSTTFLADKWFAVEEDDGKVEREILAQEGPLPAGKVFKAKGRIIAH